ncbi:MAG: DUF4212 domain-containing protein [Acidovorax sp.]|jgi:putative solute:sodium symporter small subunit|nr:DUF4212 domain-containing protein [Acidovorax sp.]MDR3015366.1 DUF4212 domain-containing protein [Delftia acidovorans]
MQQEPYSSHEAPVAEGGVFPPDLHDTHHLWLKAVLLTVWVVVSFGACFFARDLQAWGQGWPLAYWMAAQGAVLMFMLLVVIYCVAMDQFERNDSARCRNVQAGQHGRPE